MACETIDLTPEEKDFCRNLLSMVFCGRRDIESEYIVDYSRALLDTVKECLSELPQDAAAILTVMARDGKTRTEAAVGLGMEDPKIDPEDPEVFYSTGALGLRMLRHPSRSRRFRPYLTRNE